jgi:hypothetical protein
MMYSGLAKPDQKRETIKNPVARSGDPILLSYAMLLYGLEMPGHRAENIV